MWVPTPLEIGVFLTVWPQLFATATAVGLTAAMWIIRAATAAGCRLRR